MTSLVPALWRDLQDWFDFDKAPAAGQMIRVEDFTENGDYVLRAELPGMDPAKDMTVTVDNGVLKVDAERREESHEKQRTEFRYGAYHRYVTLPAGADPDKIKATYDKGILTVRIPLPATERGAARTVAIEAAE